MIGLSLLHSAHPEAFQRLLVRASIPCYRDFTLAKCRSLGFASASADSPPCSGSLSLRLGASSRSTSPATATRRFIMQKARRHPRRGSDRLWAHGFRDYFTPLEGVLFTFPSRYSFTIGLTGVFSLAGWSRPIRAGFHVPRVTQDANGPRRASRTGLSPSTVGLSRRVPLTPRVPPHGPTTPGARKSTRPGLGCSPVARHYWGNHCCFLFLRVLRCFSSPRWPRHRKCRWQAFSLPGCPIRKPADQRSFAPTRGLSQLIASFVASVSQGIHRAPFATFTDAPYPKTGKARSYFQLCHTPANIVRGTTLIRVLFSTVSLCRNMSKIVLWATTVSWRGLAERPSLVPNWCRGADWLNAHPFPTWVENIGFEPMAPCLQSRCSSQLS